MTAGLAPRGPRGVYGTLSEYAGSSTTSPLRAVNLKPADSFSTRPLRCSHSQADSRCHGHSAEKAKWPLISESGTNRFSFFR